MGPCALETLDLDAMSAGDQRSVFAHGSCAVQPVVVDDQGRVDVHLCTSGATRSPDIGFGFSAGHAFVCERETATEREGGREGVKPLHPPMCVCVCV